MSKDKKKNEYVAVGGQALMEGIMMKGPQGYGDVFKAA